MEGVGHHCQYFLLFSRFAEKHGAYFGRKGGQIKRLDLSRKNIRGKVSSTYADGAIDSLFSALGTAF